MSNDDPFERDFEEERDNLIDRDFFEHQLDQVENDMYNFNPFEEVEEDFRGGDSSGEISYQDEEDFYDNYEDSLI